MHANVPEAQTQKHKYVNTIFVTSRERGSRCSCLALIEKKKKRNAGICKISFKEFVIFSMQSGQGPPQKFTL